MDTLDLFVGHKTSSNTSQFLLNNGSAGGAGLDQPVMFDYKSYICPGCHLHYDYFKSRNIICGKVPLVLNCKHTLCEDCISRSFKKNNKILCPVCLEESAHSVKTNSFQKSFAFNHYLIGQILCSKQGTSTNVNEKNQINLVSTGKTIMKHNYSENKGPLARTLESDSISREKCGLGDCNKVGTLQCLDCNGIYCESCCTTLHNSGRSLKNHRTEPIGGSIVELKKCTEHNLTIELYCINCEMGTCCYCFLEKHEGHLRSYLCRLSEEEDDELKVLKENAVQTLKQLQATQKKIRNIEENKVSPIEIDVGLYFANLHAQLYTIEKKIREEVHGLKNQSNDLESLHMQISRNIDDLKELIDQSSQNENYKINMRALLQEFKKYNNFPCYLITEAGNSDPIKFVVSEAMKNIEDYFSIESSGTDRYLLVTADKLPDNYKHNLLDTTDVSDAETAVSSVSSQNTRFNDSRNSRTGYKPKRNHKYLRKDRLSFDIGRLPSDLEYQVVYLTHINSLECFYVQLKSRSFELDDMRRAIKNYLKQGTPKVTRVDINELYLVTFSRKDDSEWCRIRIMDQIIQDDDIFYEAFFIDFGHKRTIKKENLRHVSSGITRRAPFAIRCKLYNPSECDWSKDAHLQLAKIIDGKEVIMFNKNVTNGISEVELNFLTSLGDLTSVTDILIQADEPSLDKTPSEKTLHMAELKHQLITNTEQFVKGDYHEVYIRHVIDPHNIFIQKVSYETSLESLQSSLEKFYSHSAANIYVPIKGSDLVVEYKSNEHGNWHRARVQEVHVHKKKATVLLVDWGKRVNVNWSSIRLLADQFKKVECLAICVKLSHIIPVTGDGQWNVKATGFLTKYMSNNRVMKILVSETNPLEIVLFHPDVTFDVCINALIVEEKLALSTGKLSSRVNWMHHVEQEEGKEELPTYLSRDDDDDDSSDEEQGNLKQQVDIIQFESPDLILIKFHSNRRKEEQLRQELQISYLDDAKLHGEWNVGDKCVIYDKQAKEFCRAIIRNVEQDKVVTVYLGDRGEQIEVSPADVYKLTDYFKSFPNIVYKCHLAGIKPAGDSGKWSKMALEWFQHIFRIYKDIFIGKAENDKSRKSLPVIMWYSKMINGAALEPSIFKLFSLNKKVIRIGLAFKNNNCGYFNKKAPETPVTEVKPIDKNEDSIDTNTSIDSTVSNEVIESTDCSKLESGETSTEDEFPNTVIDIKISDWRLPLPLTEREFHAYITCAEAEGYLFLRKQDFQPVYEEMEKSLKDHFDSLPQDNNRDWVGNEMCTIRYKDSWYRGKVLKKLNRNTAKVIMIDFGSDHDVKMADLHHEIMFPDVQQLVTKVKLYNVFAKSGKWLTSDVDNLLSTVAEYSKIIIRGSLNIDIPYADVYDMTGSCLNDLLVLKCPNLARSKDAMNEDKLDDDPDCIIEEVKSDLNDDTSSNDDEQDLPVTKWTPWNALIEDEENSERGKKSVTDLVYVTLPIPCPGSEIQVDIITVLNYKTVSFYMLMDNSTKEEVFTAMSEAIQIEARDRPTLENIAIGSPCISLYSEDQKWYRARIINIDGVEVGYISVFFVDYGNVEVVSCGDIRQIKECWLEFPVKFFLANIDYHLSSKEHGNLISTHIHKLTGSTKLVRIVSEEPLKIHIYDGDKLYYQDFVDMKIVEVEE